MILGTLGIGTTSPATKLEVVSQTDVASLFTRYQDGTKGTGLVLRKARGTPDSPVIGNAGDVIGSIIFDAYEPIAGFTGGSQLKDDASIIAAIDGSATPADGNMPTNLYFRTKGPSATGSTTRMTIMNTGNVGIGTGTPGTQFDILSPTLAASTPGTLELLKISRPINSGNSYPQTAAFALGTYSTNSSGNGFGPDTRLDINLKSTSTNDYITDKTVMTLLDNGNVGIGTTSPAALLNVSGGNIQVDRDTGNANVLLKSAGTGNQPVLHGQVARGTSASPAATQSGDALLRMVTDGYGASAYSRAGEIRFVASENFTNTAAGSDFVVMTSPIGSVAPTEKIRVTASGNVGIGTTSPLYNLDVSGIVRSTTSLMTGVTSGGSYVLIQPNLDVSALNPGSTTVGGQIQAPSNGHFLIDLRNNGADDAIAFRYSASNNATVDTIGFVMKGNGNVGIGTTSPTSLLHVYHSSATGMTFERSTANNANIEYKNTLGSMFAGVNASANYAVGATAGLSSPYFLIDRTSGNVGIGTTLPSTSLYITKTVPTGTITTTGTVVSGSGTNFTSAFSVGDRIITSGQNKLISAITDDTNMTVASAFSPDVSEVSYARVGTVLQAGYVGVNKPSPQFQLHVQQTSPGAETLPLHIQNSSTTTGTTTGLSFGNTTVDNVSTAKIVNYRASSSDQGLAFYTYNGALGERVRIGGNGNVGIGTASPATFLDIVMDQDAATAMRVLNASATTSGSSRLTANSDGAAISLQANSSTYSNNAVYGSASGTSIWTSTSATGGLTIATKAGPLKFIMNSASASPRMIMDTSGNVGIGTTSPSSKLTVAGTIESTTGGVRFPDGTVQTTATSGGSGGTLVSGWPDVIMCNVTNPNIGITAFYLTVANYALDGLYYYRRIVSSNNHEVKFNADGTFNSYTTIVASNCATSISALYSTAQAFQNVGGGSFIWTASGANTYYSGGNVGIGMTSPLAALHMSSATSSSIPSLIIDGYASTTYGPSLIIRGSRGTAASPAAVLSGDRTSFFGVRPYNGTSFPSSSKAGIDSYATENQTPSAQGNALSFFTTSNGTTSQVERMRIDASGNVGIGTTEPTAPLQVTAASATPMSLVERVSSSQNVSIEYKNTASSVYAGLRGTTGGFAVAATGNLNTNPILWANTSTGIEVMNGTPGLPAISGSSQNSALRLNPAGNATLDFGFNTSGTAAGWLQVTNRVDLSVTNALLLNPNGGNVGIGTTSPSGKLHIYDSSSAFSTMEGQNVRLNWLQSDGTSNNKMWDFQVKTERFFGRLINDSNSTSVSWLIVDRTGMTVDSVVFPNGNVGIGITSPSHKFHVSGSTRVDDGNNNVSNVTFTSYPASHYITNGHVTDATLGVYGGGAFNGTTLIVGQDTNASSSWYHFKAIADTNGTPLTHFVIRGDGNVGIGTTNPTYKLDTQAGGNAVIRAGTLDNTGSYVSALQLSTGDGTSITNNVAALGVLGGETKLRFMVASNAGASATNFNANTRMTIDNNGNVGIGTTSPSTKLDVTGGNLSINASDSGGTVNSPDITQGTLVFNNRFDGSGNSTTNKIIFFDSGSVRYGIGLSSGSFNLFSGNSTSTGGFNFYTGHVSETTQGTNVLRLTGDGNVGIGTTNPGVALVVERVSSASYAATTSGATPIAASDPVIYVLNNSLTSGSAAYLVLDSNETGGRNNIAYIGSVSNAGSYVPIMIFGTRTSNNSHAERMRIDQFGNVGIGTTAPLNPLHVVGSLRVERSSTPNQFMTVLLGGSTQNVLNFTSVESNKKVTIFESVHGGQGSPGGNLDFVFRAGISSSPVELMRIKESGNVGIGTTNPSTNLEVVTSGVPQIRIIDTDAAGSGIIIGDAGSGASFFWPMFRSFPIGSNRYAWFISELKSGEDTGSHPAMVFASRYNGANDITTRPLFEWRNNSTPFMTMSVSGNVGIGTTSPSSQFHVKSFYAGSGSILEMATSNTASNMPAATLVGTTTSATPGSGVRTSLAFKFQTGDAAFTVPVEMASVQAASNTFSDAANGLLSLHTLTAGTSTEKVRVTSSGYVGIGTTAPGEALDVNGNISASTYKIGTSTVINGSRRMQPVDGNAGSPGYRFASDGNTGFYLPSVGGLGMSTNAIERLRIDSSGNVGIGTTNPESMLQVNGNITTTPNAGSYRMIGAQVNSNTTLLLQGGSTSGTGGNIELGRGGENRYDATYHQFRSLDASVEFVRINGSGYLGIGTASPSSVLDIQQNSTNATTYPLSKISNTNGTAGDGTTTFNYSSVRAEAGDGTVSGDILASYNSSGSFPAGVYVRSRTAYPLIFSTNNIERVRIDSSGNVGIGTTSPSTTLGVSGTVAANWFQPVATSTSFLGTGMYASNSGGGSYPFNGTGHVVLQSRSSLNRDIVFVTGSTPSVKMVVESSGNVGIGTTSPTANLHVRGQSSVNGSQSLFRLGTPTFPYQLQTDSESMHTYVDDSNVNFISEQNENSGTRGGFNFYMDNDGIQSPQFQIFKKSNTTNPMFAINNQGNFLMMSGNVGIGTTSPQAKLEVVGSSMITRSTSVTEQYIQLDALYSTSLGITAASKENNKKPLFFNAFHDGSGSAAGGLGFRFQLGTFASPTEIVRITESGNVGIGTTRS